MSLSDTCIRRPVLAAMINCALVLAGIVSLMDLPVRELPDIDPPIVTVTTVYSGASAEVIETEVTERIEEVVNGIEGIDTISSESREQVSVITVEFSLARDIDLAAQDVRDRVSRVRGSLPEDIEEPIVAKQDSSARPMLWVALYSERYSTRELTTLAENTIKERLQTVSGVSSVILGGAKRFAMRIRLDPERMAARGVTVLDVERALETQNVELPSGRVEGPERELAIETLGELETPEEFNRLIIAQDDDAVIRLADIGHAEIGVEDERAIARYNSRPAMGLGIVRQSKANTIAVADGIAKELAALSPLLPEGVETFIAYDESVFIRKAITQVWITLLIAFCLVVVTIYLFLQDLRSTIIPALTIPVATITTFSVLALMGYSVNILTMLGFVLAIGLVVDDSIVVLENIYRHIEEGLSPRAAAFKAIKEIFFAVIATTVALVAVFIPLAFQTSVTGRLFVEFAVALAGAVVISTFVALSLTPMASSQILRKQETQAKSSLSRWLEAKIIAAREQYLRHLNWFLDHRKASLSLIFVSAAVGYLCFSALDREFLPEEDKGRLFSIAQAPEGATSEYTDRMVKKMETYVSELPEVAGYFSAVALARQGPGQANQGLIFVRLKEDRSRSAQDILNGPQGLRMNFLFGVEGAFAIPLLPKAIGGGFGQPFQLVLQNPDLDQLQAFSGELIQRLQQEGILVNIRSEFDYTKPELSVNISRDRASRLGVSVRDISRTLQIQFGGLDISTIERGGKEYDVIVQLSRESRLDAQDLDNVYVRNGEGQLIQLSNVVSYEVASGPNAIYRFNRLRSNTIEGSLAGVPLGNAVDRVEAILEEIMPAGFRYDWKGEVEDLQETEGDATFVILLALLVTYMVLAAQFESLRDPFTVMLALPLAASGAFGLLYLLSWVNVLGQGLYGWANFAPDAPWFASVLSNIVPRIPAMNVNLFSLIGLTLLIGLVTKNSILLVEFANQKQEQGLSPKEAIIEAARIRFRPILMTAFATISGILPIAIGFGAGAESRRPMGVAAVGGMASSTFLTLVVIPVVYVLLAKTRAKTKE